MADLLDGFTFGPTTINDSVVDDHFAQHFWVRLLLFIPLVLHRQLFIITCGGFCLRFCTVN